MYMRARASEPVKSPCGKWEVTPRKYYDTLNVVVVLKGKAKLPQFTEIDSRRIHWT